LKGSYSEIARGDAKGDSIEARHLVSSGMLTTVAILSFVVLLLTMRRDFNIVDEGIILSDAMLVLKGEIVHRDFYSNYGPGQYYVVAGLFRFFGENFIIARLYDIAVRSAVVVTLFYILRRQCSLFIALIFAAIGGMWLLAIGFYLYPIFPCILLSLIASYLIINVGTKNFIWPALVGAGACAGLTALFRYDTGFLLLMANFLSIIILIAQSEPSETKISRTLRATAAYIGGTAVVFVPAAIIFLIVSPIGPFLHDIVEYPSKYYPLMRGLPFPGPRAILVAPWESAVYLPLIAAGLAFFELVRRYASGTGSAATRSSNERAMVYLIVFGSTAAMLFLKGIVRVSALHMLMGIFPALIVFAIIVDLWWRRGNAGRLAVVFAMFLVVCPAAAAAFRDVRASYRIEDRSIAGWLALRAGLISLPADIDGCDFGPASGIAKLNPEYSRVANYLAAHSQRDERILAAVGRHDKIFANPMGLYFATGRLPPTRWHQFDPGLVSRKEIQAEIIDDLKRNHVRWVVRDASFDEMNEPNGSAKSSGVTLLDQYLESNYRPVAASGKVAIWLASGETSVVIHPDGKCEASPVN
jgi:hypothetical protein